MDINGHLQMIAENLEAAQLIRHKGTIKGIIEGSVALLKEVQVERPRAHIAAVVDQQVKILEKVLSLPVEDSLDFVMNCLVGSQKAISALIAGYKPKAAQGASDSTNTAGTKSGAKKSVDNGLRGGPNVYTVFQQEYAATHTDKSKADMQAAWVIAKAAGGSEMERMKALGDKGREEYVSSKRAKKTAGLSITGGGGGGSSSDVLNVKGTEEEGGVSTAVAAAPSPFSSTTTAAAPTEEEGGVVDTLGEPTSIAAVPNPTDGSANTGCIPNTGTDSNMGGGGGSTMGGGGTIPIPTPKGTRVSARTAGLGGSTTTFVPPTPAASSVSTRKQAKQGGQGGVTPRTDDPPLTSRSSRRNPTTAP